MSSSDDARNIPLSMKYADEQVAEFVRERPDSLDILRPRLRAIVIARYSECEYQRKTLAELGKEQGVSRERIRQLEVEAKRLIRRYMDRDARKCSHCDGRGWI